MRPLVGPQAAVAVTSWGIHVPDVDLSDLVRQADGRACPAVRAAELLGRKGLLAKEPATRLALCAVHQALDRPPRAPRPDGPADPYTAVVASSNLGNVATVAEVARTVRAGHDRDVSPVEAPNASSNIVASSVAIWFRAGGPNLMVCSGATSGLDAIALACRLLRAGRARRVIVVGVEPDDATATAVYSSQALSARSPALRAGAACVVLQPAYPTDASPVPTIGSVGPFRPDRLTAARDFAFIGPAELAPVGGRVIDLERRDVSCYGALGVLGTAIAAAIITDETRITVVCGNQADGWRAAVINGSQRARA